MIILNNWVSESVQIFLSDHVFPLFIGVANQGLADTVFTFQPSQPDTFILDTTIQGNTTNYVSANIKIRKKEFVKLDLPTQGDLQTFQNLKKLFNPSFNSANLKIPAQVLSPNNSGARFDYKNGTIIKSGTVTAPLQALYSYQKVRILTTWPENMSEEVDLPTISIEDRLSSNASIEIGSIRKRRTVTLFIDLWAASDGQRGYLNTILEQAFKLRVPLLNLGLGYPTKSSGTDRGERNLAFNANTQRVTYMRVDDFQISNIPIADDTPKVERYRSSGKLVLSYI